MVKNGIFVLILNFTTKSLDYGDETQNVEHAAADVNSFKNFLDEKQAQTDKYNLFKKFE